MSRYARQNAVAELGAEGTALLRAARVLVVGAGGLASPVLQYLGGAGIGHLRLVDPDRVDLSNLHRQTLFCEHDIGRAKARVAATHVNARNTDCAVDAVVGVLDPDTVKTLCAGMDLVLDCADSFAASYILSDTCAAMDLPLISASAIGLEGYVGGFCSRAPGLRAVFPELPARLGNCAEDGVLGPVVGVLGALQAQMAIAVLAGLDPSPMGRLVTFDAVTFRFGGFRFDAAPEPEGQHRFIAPSAMRDDDFIVDLRAKDEGPRVRPDARRLDVDAFGPGGPTPAEGQRAVLCCRSGLRSWQAAERLAAVWDGEISLVAVGNPNGAKT